MITTGCRACFNRDFLRSTGQYTGPDAPCSYGPFARGTVEKVGEAFGDSHLITIRWDNDHTTRCLDSNLERCR